MTAIDHERVYEVAVVVGSYLGGVSAAVRASEPGASVMLLVEAGHELGGTALFSGGVIHSWGAQSLEEYGQHSRRADQRLARTLFDNFRPYVDWLVGTGALGFYGTTALRGLALTKYQIGDGIAPSGRIRWFRYLGERLVALGGIVLTNARAIAINRSETGVMRIQVAYEGAEPELQARTVVLAIGDFQASPELLAEHVGPGAASFITRSVHHDIGDGLRLASSLGSVTTVSMKTRTDIGCLPRRAGSD